jgi:hypothetical protein
MLLSEQSAKVLDRFVRALRVVLDVAERLVELLGPQHPVGREPAKDVRINLQRRERLSDLMGDRSRKLAESGQTKRVGEVVPLPPRFYFGLPPARFGPPALCEADEKADDQRALRHGDSDPGEDVALVHVPQREGAMTDLGSRGQTCVIETPPTQLFPVDDVRIHGLLDHREVRRGLAAQYTDADLRRLTPVCADA